MRGIAVYLGTERQRQIVSEVKPLISTEDNPLFNQKMQNGAPLKYRNTSLGEYGWEIKSDGSYGYGTVNPITNKPYPPIPPSVLAVVEQLRDFNVPPKRENFDTQEVFEACLRLHRNPWFIEDDFRAESCLINLYTEIGTLGMHQDKDEKSRNAIISISLGCDALFELGSTTAKVMTESVILKSGHVFILSGADRYTYHGIKKILPNTGPSVGLKPNMRMNLSIRQVTA